MNKELRIRFNGIAKWAILIIFALTILYNTLVTHITMRNDIEHLAYRVERLEKRIDDYLLKK